MKIFFRILAKVLRKDRYVFPKIYAEILMLHGVGLKNLELCRSRRMQSKKHDDDPCGSRSQIHKTACRPH